MPETPAPCTGLKIKIPKDKIKTESITELTQQSLAPPLQPTIGIKLKIPKEKLNNCISLELSSKKRERDKSSPTESQPAKIPKLSYKDAKQNGRHSYNKVSKSSTVVPSTPISYPPPKYPLSPQSRQVNFMPPRQHSSTNSIPSIMTVDTMIPPPSSNPPIYFYPHMAPPPPPPPPPTNLPNMSIPPPNYMYPYYQGFVYPPEYYSQPLLPTNKNLNPPLPTEAPPSLPPPPPPE